MCEHVALRASSAQRLERGHEVGAFERGLEQLERGALVRAIEGALRPDDRGGGEPGRCRSAEVFECGFQRHEQVRLAECLLELNEE